VKRRGKHIQEIYYEVIALLVGKLSIYSIQGIKNRVIFFEPDVGITIWLVLRRTLISLISLINDEKEDSNLSRTEGGSSSQSNKDSLSSFLLKV
jgi:hypothetical protein